MLIKASRTADNTNKIDGYAKILTLPKPYQGSDISKNYPVSQNNNTFILDLYWVGVHYSYLSSWAKFYLTIYDNNELRLVLLSKSLNGNCPEKPLAYVVTDNGIDVYACSSIKEYNTAVHYVLTSISCPMFEILHYQPFENIDVLNPIFIMANVDYVKNVKLVDSKCNNVNLNDIRTLSFYTDNGSLTFKIMNTPNATDIHYFDVLTGKAGKVTSAKIVLNVPGAVVYCDNSNISVSYNSDTRELTIGGFDYYSYINIIERLYS